MGGIIAQLVSAIAPEKTLSLTAIMATTGNPELPQAEPDVLAMLLKPKPSPILAKDNYIEDQLAFDRRIANTKTAFDEAYYRDYIERCLVRNPDPDGIKRQISAFAITGDIRQYLQNITAKTLVIHGDQDSLTPITCGKDIADNIANATFMPIEGMGHDLPPAYYDEIASAIIQHMKQH